MAGVHQKLTPSDVEKIKAEIDHRVGVVRPQILDEVKEARKQGDYSENYELYAAKRAKNQNESRIRYLQNVLKNSEVISTNSAADVVGINNVVTLYDMDLEEEATYKITTAIRADSLDDRLDMDSPLAKALMGHREGDIVHVVASSDVEYDVEIRKIENSNDESESIREF